MRITASSKTAAMAGVWSSIGLSLGDAWLGHAQSGSGLAGDLAWFSGAAVFFYLPVFFLVIGRHTCAFSRLWLLDPKERAAYWPVMKRMLVWFACTGVSMIVVSAVISFASHRAI